MRAAFLLAWRDLSAQRWRVLALGSVFSLAVLAYVTLGSYREALEADYQIPTGDWLVVQQAHTIAEFYGSRISEREVRAVLESRGVENAVPEIHELVGTSFEDAVLLRGVDLEGYADKDIFQVIEGRALKPGDTARNAMIGTRLAARLQVQPAEMLRLRGRNFQVVGVFETGSYPDNEAWISISDAQNLLGWEEEVSLFVVPDDGNVSPGEQLMPGVTVQQRGERSSEFPQSWEGLLMLILVVTQAIGAAAALSLAVMLWRIAWQRRWQIAVLRSLGFSRMISLGYLGLQGSLITFLGGAAGLIGALALMRLVRVSLNGLSVQPSLSAELLFTTIAWLGALTGLGVLVPVWMLGRQRVSQILKGE